MIVFGTKPVLPVISWYVVSCDKERSCEGQILRCTLCYSNTLQVTSSRGQVYVIDGQSPTWSTTLPRLDMWFECHFEICKWIPMSNQRVVSLWSSSLIKTRVFRRMLKGSLIPVPFFLDFRIITTSEVIFLSFLNNYEIKIMIFFLK